MKIYGTLPSRLDDYPDKGDLFELGRTNRQAKDRRAARRFFNKKTRRLEKSLFKDM